MGKRLQQSFFQRHTDGLQVLEKGNAKKNPQYIRSYLLGCLLLKEKKKLMIHTDVAVRGYEDMKALH